ncbi:MAG: HD domain-containing protein [Deltaproteobacteria bacterium]|jgi:putative hydrolase of HD superfamily|nr:HD domain-containing protein [Deltaproteobacteria bacterium]
MADKPEGQGTHNRLADFIYEALFLKHTPRTGYKFLGRGKESVAEHSFGVTLVSFALARMSGKADLERLLKMALFHDLAEARTGDLNYMNKRYVTAHEGLATKDLAEGLPFEGELLGLFREWKEGASLEARLAADADQIDMLVELARHRADGSEAAAEWIRYALMRLKTEEGKALAQAVLSASPDGWWFEKKESFWVSPKGPGDGGDKP